MRVGCIAGRHTISLPALLHLRFHCSGNQEMGTIFSLIEAPRLIRFHTSFTAATDLDFMRSNTALLARIRALSIGGPYCSEEYIRAIFLMAPSVSDLDVATGGRELAVAARGCVQFWSALAVLRLRNPNFDDLSTIITTIAVDHLHIHYSIPSCRMSAAAAAWSRSTVHSLTFTVRPVLYWYSDV